MDDKDWTHLARYFAGEASQDEEAEIRCWLEADPARARMVDSMRRVWELSQPVARSHGGDARRVWTRIATEIHSPSVSPAPPPAPEVRRSAPPAPPRTRVRGWGRAPLLWAAAVLVVALVPLLWGPASDILQRHPPAGAVREFATRKGQVIRLTLGDGSVVELGAASRLRVPVPFAGNERELQLEGMALFQVAHDPARPFRVHARGALTRVLGTEFVVRAYSGEGSVDVAVLEGRVALRPLSVEEQTGTVLTSGQLGRLARDGMVNVIQDGDEFRHLVAWTSGRLEFTDQPLSAVLSELEHWYGVEFRVPDPELASQRVSTVIEGDRLGQMLDVLALVLDARYEQRGDTITFRSNR